MMVFMNKQIQRAIQLALSEDIGTGDVTTLAIVPADQWRNGRFLTKAPVSSPVWTWCNTPFAC